MESKHSPGRVVFCHYWRELRLEENHYVIATLRAPHPSIRGKQRIEELATIRANGERLAALWNAVADSKRFALNPDNGLMYESERGPWIRYADIANPGSFLRKWSRVIEDGTAGVNGDPTP